MQLWRFDKVARLATFSPGSRRQAGTCHHKIQPGSAETFQGEPIVDRSVEL